jgi:uncharacterized membrane protein
MLPLTELRGSIPFFFFKFNLNIYFIYFVACLGNILLGVITIYLFDFFVFIFSKIAFFKKIIDLWQESVRKRSAKKFSLYGHLALILFVAIPLPMTGVFTGAVASRLFNIPKGKSILLLSIGVFIAGIIVSVLTVLGKMLI